MAAGPWRWKVHELSLEGAREQRDSIVHSNRTIGIVHTGLTRTAEPAAPSPVAAPSDATRDAVSTAPMVPADETPAMKRRRIQRRATALSMAASSKAESSAALPSAPEPVALPTPRKGGGGGWR
jgi:hypothetical protein